MELAKMCDHVPSSVFIIRLEIVRDLVKMVYRFTEDEVLSQLNDPTLESSVLQSTIPRSVRIGWVYFACLVDPFNQQQIYRVRVLEQVGSHILGELIDYCRMVKVTIDQLRFFNHEILRKPGVALEAYMRHLRIMPIYHDRCHDYLKTFEGFHVNCLLDYTYESMVLIDLYSIKEPSLSLYMIRSGYGAHCDTAYMMTVMNEEAKNRYGKELPTESPTVRNAILPTVAEFAVPPVSTFNSTMKSVSERLAKYPKVRLEDASAARGPPVTPALSIAPAPAPITSKQSTVDRQVVASKLNVGQTYQATITHVEDGPFSFSVQIESSRAAINELSAFLQRYQPVLNDSPLIPGSEILAKSHGNLFRARVMTVTRASCLVYYIDYGNSEDVPHSDIYAYPTKTSDLLQLPALAHNFCLAGLRFALISEAVKDRFKEEFLRKSVTIHVVPPEGCPSIQYCDATSGGVPLLDFVTKMVAPLEYTSQYPPKSRTTDVVVSFADGPSHFFVQYVSEMNTIHKISEALNKYCPAQRRIENISSLVMGSPVAALFPADHDWYRALIVGLDEHTVKVFSVDYGNLADVTPKDICHLNYDLVSTWRCQAIECCLTGFETASPVASVTAKMIQLTRGLPFTMKLHSILNGTRLSVDLIDHQGNSIGEIVQMVYGRVHPKAALSFSTERSPPKDYNRDYNKEVKSEPFRFRSDRENEYARPSSESTCPQGVNQHDDRTSKPWKKDFERRPYNDRKSEIEDWNSPKHKSWESTTDRRATENGYDKKNWKYNEDSQKHQNSNGEERNRFKREPPKPAVLPPTVTKPPPLPSVLFEYRLLNLTQDVDYTVYLASFEAPNELWVQLDGAEALLSQIRRIIDSDEGARSRALTHVEHGAPVLANYPDDGLLYRAIIRENLADKAKVLFVDYGNTAVIPLSDLYITSTEICRVPAQAVKVVLNDICAPSSGWPDLSELNPMLEIEKFTLRIKFMKVFDREMVVHGSLTCPDGETVSHKLIQGGLAVDVNAAHISDKTVEEEPVRDSFEEKPAIPEISPPALHLPDETAEEEPVRDSSEEKPVIPKISPPALHLPDETAEVGPVCVTFEEKLATPDQPVPKSSLDVIDDTPSVQEELTDAPGEWNESFSLLIGQLLQAQVKSKQSACVYELTIIAASVNVAAEFNSVVDFEPDVIIAVNVLDVKDYRLKVEHVSTPPEVLPYPVVATRGTYTLVHADDRVAYLQSDSDIAILNRVLDELFYTYDNTEPGIEPLVGSHVAAKSSDGNWYRGVRIDEHNVLFCDYGNTEEISPESMRELDTKFYGSEHCLSGVVNVDGDLNLKDYLNERFQVEIHSNNGWLLDLRFVDGDKLVDVVGARVKFVPGPASYIKPKMIVPVTVSHADSVDSFWVFRMEDADALSLIQNQLINPPVGEELGDIFAAKYGMDEAWYRAVETGPDTVRFIDYGNTDPAVDRRPLAPHLREPPGYAIPVHLCASPIGSTWCQEADNYFKTIIEKNDVALKIININFKIVVDIIFQGEEISKVLISKGWAFYDDHCQPKPQPQHQNLFYFCCADSVLEFYVQKFEDKDQLDQIAADLSVELEPLSEVKKGDLVAALFPVDDIWYRAEVLTENPCTVKFIDYGNISEVEQVKKLPVHLNGPALAHCYCLDVEDTPESNAILADLALSSDPVELKETESGKVRIFQNGIPVAFS